MPTNMKRLLAIPVLLVCCGAHAQTTETLLDASFDGGADGFSYQDDSFRATGQPAYASGAHDDLAGALRVDVGGIDRRRITGMSGGWTHSFSLAEESEVTLSFDYNLSMSSQYESNERSEVLAALDGTLHGLNGQDFIDTLAGNGNGGATETTGWRSVVLDLGSLPGGTHELVLGAYNNQKTFSNEFSDVLLDNVLLTRILADDPPPPPPAASDFSVELLDRPLGFQTVPFDMNASGEAVGYYLDFSLNYRAIFWDGVANIVDLADAGTWSQAHGIADNGLITGYYGPTLQTTKVVVWNQFSPVELNVNGNPIAYTNNVNSDGITVGAMGSSSQTFATFWSGTDPVSPSGQNEGTAIDINENGDAVGWVMVGGFPRAAHWDDQGNLTLLAGINGGDTTGAQVIAEDGRILGSAWNEAGDRILPVVWATKDSAPVPLQEFEGLNGTARGVNSAGWVVGTNVSDPYNNSGLALLWDVSGTPADLNTLIPEDSGWNLIDAIAVNDAGQILGAGTVSGKTGIHAFRLTPVAQ